MIDVGKVTETGNLVSTLLARSWRSSISEPINMTRSELDRVMPQICASGAAALGWWRLRNTDLRGTESAESLQEAYRLQTLKAAIYEEHIVEIFRRLQEAGVDPILVKGRVAAALYPEPGLRAYGDIDLLVRSEHFKTAETVIASRISPECWVDLHNEFFELNDRSIAELFERSRFIELNGERIRVLAGEDHLALLAVHLLKHGAFRPLWLCDIAATIESVSNSFDWNICLGRIKRREGWISVAIGLARRLLRAEPAHLDQRADVDVPDWLVKSVLKHWGQLFPANHLPVQPLPLMASNLRSPWKIVKATRQRWPDPITATFNLNRDFGRFPRLPYQLGEFASRSVKFLFDLPVKLDRLP